MADGSEFKWDDDDESVVTHGVRATAVYLNPRGEVVIRQATDDSYSDVDAVIVLPVPFAEQLLKRLAVVIEEAKEPAP